MGPRFFKRGNASIYQMLSRKTKGFNGAALFQARKLPRQVGGNLGQKGLQWGRAFSSAEIELPVLYRHPISVASMGPRFFKRGNLKKSASDRFKRVSFNGAALFQARKFN